MQTGDRVGAPDAIRGKPVDASTRCVHWRGPLDIVAFRFACCDGWWPCHACHEETTRHPARPWPIDRFGQPSVRCGSCGRTLTFPAYMASGSRCPSCKAGFNPECETHWPLYADIP